MKLLGWLTFAVVLSSALAPVARAEEKKIKLGMGPAYEALGKLPVQHLGRLKPIDTLAREEVKQIFGRETIWFSKTEKTADGKTVEEITSWGPVAALFDWTVRRSFWDDQPFILVEFVPLKRLILAEEIQTRLNAAIDRKTTSEADRTALKALLADDEISATKLRAFLTKSNLPGSEKAPEEDRKSLSELATLLSEEHKWLTPRQIDDAMMPGESGEKVSFMRWYGMTAMKKEEAQENVAGDIKITDIERRGVEVGSRLSHYKAIRDRTMRQAEPSFLIMPRPSNKAYLTYIAGLVKKARENGSAEGLTPIELDAAKALDVFWQDFKREERDVPGEKPEFDEQFIEYLRVNAVWIPLLALLDAKPTELESAGFPVDKTSAFLSAFRDLEKAEIESPGQVSEAKTTALLASSRALGESLNSSSYPSVASIDREAYFNSTNPFFKAPAAYGFAVILLAVYLGFLGFPKGTFLAQVGRVLYVGGIIGLLAGIALETLGFYLRVMISGWAPVTNMYETVIWVSLVSAVLGLFFELIFRKAYTALAGSGVALLGTVLAANVPLLDPNIKSLQPVLRSNYWLTIHVLTEVSSYGAFLLAAFLGLIATIYYLTATYRRSPGFGELALLLVPGLPLFAIGTAGILGSYGYLGTSLELGNTAYIASGFIAAAGGICCLGSVLAMGGELASRLTFRDQEACEEMVGESRAEAGHSARAERSAQAHASGSGNVATLTKPTVAEIRAMAVANRPKLDARGQAMQETASKIKPLSNFIYRAMQVGVLLIAAGTILGGFWADVSWGRFWGWDAKEVWALITLLVYLVPLHGRFAGWFNTFWLVFASVVCSISVIMAWYGVNFVIGVGLHSYGFVEGGGQLSVFAVLAAVMAIPVGAAWRRKLASKSLVPA